MFLVAVSNKGHILPCCFFEEGLRIKAEVLSTVVKPWIDEVAARRDVLQQDFSPAYQEGLGVRTFPPID